MKRVIQENSRMLIASLVVLAGISLALFRLTHTSAAFSARANWVMCDFFGAVYYPVVAFLSGENPYDVERFLALYPISEPFPLYLPAVLLVHLPLGFMLAQTASIVYFVLTIALMFLLVFVCLSLHKIKVTLADILFIGGLLLLSRPGHWNLLLGQPTLQVIIASYVALYFARHSVAISSLSLAVSMIKPTFGVPIALIMLIQRHMRQVFYGAFITVSINLFLFVVLVRRSGGIDYFLKVLIKNHEVWLNDVTVNPVSSHAVDLNTFISHFIGKPLDYIVQLVIVVVVLGIAGCALRPPARPEDERFHALSIGIMCLTMLLSVHHQPYDLLLLTLPVIGLVYHKFPQVFYASYRYSLSLGLLLILALNYAATYTVIPFGQTPSVLWLVLVSINSTVLLVLFFTWIRAAHLVRMQHRVSVALP